MMPCGVYISNVVLRWVWPLKGKKKKYDGELE